jgi:hypothetical protein
MGENQRFSDRVIGVVVGFVFILVAAGLVGVPGRDLMMWALVFALAGAVYLWLLRRRSK